MSSYIQVFLVIVLSAIPWTCYHVVRIVFHPLAKDIISWDSLFLNVDMVFVFLYAIILGVLVLLSRLF